MTTHDWKAAHAAAMEHPEGTEVVMAALIRVCGVLSRRYADDYVLRGGVAHLLLGTNQLLNGATGRLDCGTLSGMLDSYAERISFDFRTEKFTDGSEL